MKKILLVIFIIALLVPLSLCVTAHPGKTDSNGGHTDHATGEYHYHHGYSAHDHYDMDGDGVKDCPYEFRDNTDHSSGSEDSNSIDFDIDVSNLPTINFDDYTLPPIDVPPSPTEKQTNTPTNKNTNGDESNMGEIIIVIGFFIGLNVLSYFIAYKWLEKYWFFWVSIILTILLFCLPFIV